MFQTYVQTDVTCVQIFKQYLAAGVGGFLHTYELPKIDLIQRKKIFEGQKIYGIKPNSQNEKLIVYGGKHIAVIPFKGTTVDNPHILSDWILDAKWIDNDTKIATVFMHNKIIIWSDNFTSKISVKCEERCILYSAHICYDYYNQLLVLSGTVFSEILLWKPFYTEKDGLSPVLKRLKKHKGVIFSINFNLENGLICSASDDRSAILWKVANAELLSEISPTNSNLFRITVGCQVYGHLSRVFRCLIMDNYFITAGEDSTLMLWNFDGVLLRKIDTHQGGPIWSICCDSSMDVICSGGNDGGILTFKAHPRIIKETICLPTSECPKIIKILQSGNIISLSDEATLYYRTESTTQWNEVARHTDLQKYSLLEVSMCKKMVALAGFEGQIYIYREINGTLKLLHIYTLKNRTRIFSFHWIDCKTFLVSQKDGVLILFFIYKHEICYVQTFILPPAKERWPTCVCVTNGHILVGDRKGNMHNFRIGTPNVINSLKKSHSYLGVTNVFLENGVVISLGRDGFLKRYKLLDGYLQCIGYNKTKFSWLTAVENNCLLSFSGDNFIISDLRFQRILFETHCGGGHRSWDYFLNHSKYITFSFIKQQIIHTIKIALEDLKPREIIEGYHVSEINCLKVVRVGNNHIIISGGEDTILRLSLMRKNNEMKIIESLKAHLSSIRAINICPLKFENNCEEYLLFTAGGRAQIICWILRIEITNDIKLSCTEKFNFYEPLTRQDAETRIMDLCSTSINNRVFLFAGCSDGFIKIFQISNDLALNYQNSILHSHHSITKIMKITGYDTELLTSMATDGILKFWSLTDIYDSRESPALNSFKLHQSGITSCSYFFKNINTLLFLSGGDDNCVSLTLFKLEKSKHAIVITQTNTFQHHGIHCAQITGAYLTDKYFITSSIDQRIIINKWTCTGSEIEFERLRKYNTVIADLQGLEVLSNENNFNNLYVYGNGVECLEIELL